MRGEAGVRGGRRAVRGGALWSGLGLVAAGRLRARIAGARPVLLRGARRAACARRGSGRSDRGSATVWSVAVIAALCAVFGAVLALGQAVAARHRAAGGADLAALAAADHWAAGGRAACARAEHVARAQSTRLVRCVVTGPVADVTAESGKGPFTAQARARAGPADPASGGPLPPSRRAALGSQGSPLLTGRAGLGVHGPSLPSGRAGPGSR